MSRGVKSIQRILKQVSKKRPGRKMSNVLWHKKVCREARRELGTAKKPSTGFSAMSQGKGFWVSNGLFQKRSQVFTFLTI